ncbi:MAG: hypothetical protein RLZZ488_343 [Pseudomonadota bacterium]
MKILGIIGGVSWHSSAEYYRLLNLRIAERLGVRHSARIVMSSLDFADLLDWQRDADESRLKHAFLAEGQRLKSAGCDAFVIASHTLSWLGDLIEAELGLQHISLYDALFNRLRSLGAQQIGLLGTKYTMSDPLYRQRYESSGFAVLIPDEPHFTATARIVYKELVAGVFRPESEEVFMRCIDHLAQRGADAVVLGCTEIGLLVHARQWRDPANATAKPVALVDLIDTHVSECVRRLVD